MDTVHTNNKLHIFTHCNPCFLLQVDTGDTIDVVSSEQRDATKVFFSRVAVVLIGENLTKKDNYHVILKRFKDLSISKENFGNEYTGLR